MASRNPTQRVRRLHQALLGFFLATAGLVFQVCSAEFPRDIHEWEEPAVPEPGASQAAGDQAGTGPSYPSLDCDPDVLIWQRFCPECVSNRPVEHCSDAALR